MIISYDELKKIRAEHKDEKIVLVKGSFDLFHIGHLNLLKKSKLLGDILVVVVKSDEAVKKKSPNRPIISEVDRSQIIDSIIYTDYCIIANKQTDSEMNLLTDRYEKIIKDLHPDIFIKQPNHSIPENIIKTCEKQSTNIVEIERTEGISTTNIIYKIKEPGIRTAIGQDSHKFDSENKNGKRLILAGVEFENELPLLANSDGDVILHAITNAISGITTVNILGDTTKKFLKAGITDSKVYLYEALKHLDGNITHISISIECMKPRISPKINEMRKNLAKLLDMKESSIGITATSGEELTEFGKGNGINVFVCLTVKYNEIIIEK